MATNGAKPKAAQPEAPHLLNKSIKTGLTLNATGVGLFLLWLFIQNRLPLAFSLALAIIFCGLLGSSLVYLLRGARQTPQPTHASRNTKND